MKNLCSDFSELRLIRVIRVIRGQINSQAFNHGYRGWHGWNSPSGLSATFSLESGEKGICVEMMDALESIH